MGMDAMCQCGAGALAAYLSSKLCPLSGDVREFAPKIRSSGAHTGSLSGEAILVNL